MRRGDLPRPITNPRTDAWSDTNSARERVTEREWHEHSSHEKKGVLRLEIVNHLVAPMWLSRGTAGRGRWCGKNKA